MLVFLCRQSRHLLLPQVKIRKETVPWTSEFLVRWVLVVLHDRLPASLQGMDWNF